MNLITLSYTNEQGDEKQLQFSQDLLKSPFNEKSLLVTKVNGQSMEPVIYHESLLVSDLSQKELEHDKIYLIFFENNLWVKQAKKKDNKFIFVSINPEYSHLIYEESAVNVVSRVLLTFTNL